MSQAGKHKIQLKAIDGAHGCSHQEPSRWAVLLILVPAPAISAVPASLAALQVRSAVAEHAIPYSPPSLGPKP